MMAQADLFDHFIDAFHARGHADETAKSRPNPDLLAYKAIFPFQFHSVNHLLQPRAQFLNITTGGFASLGAAVPDRCYRADANPLVECRPKKSPTSRVLPLRWGSQNPHSTFFRHRSTYLADMFIIVNHQDLNGRHSAFKDRSGNGCRGCSAICEPYFHCMMAIVANHDFLAPNYPSLTRQNVPELGNHYGNFILGILFFNILYID